MSRSIFFLLTPIGGRPRDAVEVVSCLKSAYVQYHPPSLAQAPVLKTLYWPGKASSPQSNRSCTVWCAVRRSRNKRYGRSSPLSLKHMPSHSVDTFEGHVESLCWKTSTKLTRRVQPWLGHSPHVPIIVVIPTPGLIILVIVRITAIAVAVWLGWVSTSRTCPLGTRIILILRLTVVALLLWLMCVGLWLLTRLRCCRWGGRLLSFLLLLPSVSLVLC